MSQRPLLSVVMPTYRQQDLLAGALDSLAAQELPHATAEIVVVDDGTPDFTPDDVDLATSPHPVRWICLPENGGRSRARNHGIRAAAGEIIVFLDGDMATAPGFLAAHADFHRAHPGEVAVGAIRFGPWVPRNAMTRYIHSRGVQGHRPGDTVPYKCFVTGNSSVARRQLEEVGLFDEGLSHYGGEDLELGLRLHRAGVRFRFAAEARALHGHARPFREQLCAMETYGRTGIPHLVARHPELATVLQVDVLHRRTPRALALRLTLSSAVYRPVRWLTSGLLWAPLPGILFSYLWWCSRTRGYRAATRAATTSAAATGAPGA